MAMTKGERKRLNDILTALNAELKTAKETKTMFSGVLYKDSHYQYWNGVQDGIERAKKHTCEILKQIGAYEQQTKQRGGKR